MDGTGIHFRDARGPDGIRIYAVGDIHGRLDLLEKMHHAIHADLAKHGNPDRRIIHLGDYVDRGPDSKGVIDFLIARGEADDRVLCLAGNHDAGFLDFLVKPDDSGLFARYGGKETALSYGVDIDFSDPDAFLQHHAALVAAVTQSHRRFISDLAFEVVFGDFFFCHAGIRPGVTLNRQKSRDLIWIRDEFLNHTGLHPKVIVHGHTPVEEAEIRPNHVNVDTGAFKTGRLSAIVINGDDKHILTVEDQADQRAAVVTP